MKYHRRLSKQQYIEYTSCDFVLDMGDTVFVADTILRTFGLAKFDSVGLAAHSGGFLNSGGSGFTTYDYPLF